MVAEDDWHKVEQVELLDCKGWRHSRLAQADNRLGRWPILLVAAEAEPGYNLD